MKEKELCLKYEYGCYRGDIDYDPEEIDIISFYDSNITFIPEKICTFTDIREVETEYDAWTEKKCSCGEWIDVTTVMKPNYCPNCGKRCNNA